MTGVVSPVGQVGVPFPACEPTRAMVRLVPARETGETRTTFASEVIAGRHRRRSRLRLAWLTVVALSMLVGVAHAAPRTGGRAHLERGLALYRSGSYAAAIAEFEAGYALLPRPAFLLNIAQAWRKLGQLERARSYYQRFVERAPAHDPARPQVLVAIEKIDAQLREPPPAEANVAAAAPAPGTPSLPAGAPPSAGPGAPSARTPPLPTTTTTTPPPPSPPPPTTTTTQPPLPTTATAPPFPTAQVAVTGAPPPRRHAWGWAGVGLVAAGAAALGAATGFAVIAARLDGEYAHPAAGAVYDPQLYDRRALDRNLTIGLYAGGGALAVTGALLAVVGLRQRARPGPAPALSGRAGVGGGLCAGGGGGSVEVRF